MFANLLIKLVSIIGGGIGGAVTQVLNIMKSGFKYATQFHTEGIALAKDLGMSLKDAQAYTEVLTNRTQELAHKYGVTAEEIHKIQKGLADATGRQLMLSNADHERLLQIQKLVGDQTLNKFTEQLMTKMGGQIQTVQGAVSKAYMTAAKSGLNAAKFSDKVAQNLSLANKLTFKNGVDGITKMTALSEKLGFNLQSVERAADKFLDLDQAISSSANLQMLGGAAGAFGSNPLAMAYEANYDMEAFTERMTKMLGGYATFDAAKGISNVNGMNRDFVKAIADALGMGMDEAMTIAKKQAEIKYKENTFGAAIARYGTENQDFLMNRSYVKNGQLMMADTKNGGEINISNGELTKELIEQMKQFDNKTEKQIMEEQAKQLTDINQQLKGLGASIAADFAKKIVGYFPQLTQDVRKFGAWARTELKPVVASFGNMMHDIFEIIRQNAPVIKTVASAISKAVAKIFGIAAQLLRESIPVIEAIGKGIQKVADWFADNKDTIHTIATYIGKTANFIVDNLGPILIGYLGYKAIRTGVGIARWVRGTPTPPITPSPTRGGFMRSILRGIGNGFKWVGRQLGNLGGAVANGVSRAWNASKPFVGRVLTQGKNLAANAARGVKSVGASRGFWDVMLGRQHKNSAGRWVNSKGRDISNNLAKVGKIAKVGGAVVGAGIGIYQGVNALTDYRNKRDELNTQLQSGAISKAEYDKQMNSAKVDRNTDIGGAIGTAIGGVAGSFFGPLGAAAGAWLGEKAGKWFGENWDTISEYAGKAWDGVSKLATRAWDGITSLASRGLNAASRIAHNVYDTVSNAASRVFNGISEFANNALEGAARISQNVMDGISGAISTVTNTITSVATTVFNGIGNFANNALNAASTTINNVIDGARNAASRAMDAVSRIASRVGDGISRVASDAYEGARSLVRDAYNGARRIGGDLYNWLFPNAKSNKQGANNPQSTDFGTSLLTRLDAIIKLLANDKNVEVEVSSNSAAKNVVEQHTNGGLVGGNSFSGDKILAGLNSGEMILNKGQQSNLFNFIDNLPKIFGSSNNSTVNNSSSSVLSNVMNGGSMNYIIGNTNNGGNSLTTNAFSSMSNSGAKNLITLSTFGDNRYSYASSSNVSNIPSYTYDSSTSLVNGNTSNFAYTNNGGVSNALSSSSFIGGNDLSNTSIASASNSENSSVSNVMSTVFRNPSNIMASALELNSDLKTVPFGGESFKELPRLSQAASQDSAGVKDVHVNDINVNISGTIKLDGGNMSKDIDINKLLGNSDFVSKLKSIIEESINREANGGRLSSHWSYSR